MYVVLVYDISQEKNGAKRWSKVFKISKKYLSHNWIRLLYLKADKKSG